VCPALFDLGEWARVVVVPVTQGDHLRRTAVFASLAATEGPYPASGASVPGVPIARNG
jgi:hypothetical protein